MKFPNIASKLKSATTNINIASASTPSNGQVLTATSSTAATWQTPTWGVWTPVYETNIDWQLFTWTISQFVVTASHTLAWVYASLQSLPTWSNVTIQVYKNWLASTNSIFTSDTPLSIATSTWATNWVYSVLDTAIDNGSLVAWDVVYIVVTATGSTLPWSSLYIKAY